MKSISIGAGLLFLMPFVAFASPVIRSGESVTIGQDQVVMGDLYAGGGSVALSGAVEGDAYIGSGVATLNAPISADATVLAGTVRVHAPVGDDLRAVAGEVTLADSVAGDVVVFGGSLHVLSTASIKGDIIFFGGELIVEGPVSGSIFGSAEVVRIDAAVRSNVEITAYEELTLGDRASIDGSVTYKSSKDMVRAQNAVIVGDIQKDEIELREAAFAPETFIVPFLMLLFAALTLYLVCRKRLPLFLDNATKRYGFHGLIGLAILGGVPFVAIILMVSMLGLFVGLFLIAVYAAFILFSFVLASIVVGSLVMKYVVKRTDLSIVTVAVGAFIFQVVSLVPFVGFLAVLALIAVTLGSLVTEAYRKLI